MIALYRVNNWQSSFLFSNSICFFTIASVYYVIHVPISITIVVEIYLLHSALGYKTPVEYGELTNVA